MKFRLLLVLFLFSREVYAGDTINSIGHRVIILKIRQFILMVPLLIITVIMT